jgi:hypothetical protein
MVAYHINVYLLFMQVGLAVLQDRFLLTHNSGFPTASILQLCHLEHGTFRVAEAEKKGIRRIHTINAFHCYSQHIGQIH